MRPTTLTALLAVAQLTTWSCEALLQDAVSDGVPKPAAHGGRIANISGEASAELPVANAEPAELVVRLPTGPIRGKQVGQTREFLGIPYGKPATGRLRFAPPEPAEAWDGTLDATQLGAACPQMSIPFATPLRTSEDCLNLNVYAPRTANALPVMVFLPGGAFVTGTAGTYDGKILSESDVIVVSVNYRLGALGFFSSDAADATRPGAPSGSDGIRDQQLALQWVQENIDLFGGDPANVTVFGESAGAISTCIHYVSPQGRKLAQRFIMQSGTCTNDGVGVMYKTDSRALSQQLTAALCPSAADAMACLRNKSAQELMDWGRERTAFGPGWVPAIEGRGGVLPDVPERLIAEAEALPELIVGTNRNEWGLYQELGYAAPTTRTAYEATIQHQFGGEAQRVLDHYAVQTDAEAAQQYMRLATDVAYRCPARSMALLASGRGANVYMYSFEEGPAYHSQELDYVFGGSLFTYYGGGPPDAALQSTVQRYWTRFAADGDPNGEDDTDWPTYSVTDDRHLALRSNPTADAGLSRTACAFWRDYFLQGGSIILD